MIIALFWMGLFPKLINKQQREEESEAERVGQSSSWRKEDREGNKKLLLLSIVTLAFYGVATNLIKDGLTTWVPSILNEQYNLDFSFSIILTLSLPVISIFSNAFAVKTHRKIADYVQCAIMFLCSSAIIGAVIAGVAFNQFLLTLIGFTLVCFLVSACNSVITSNFPLFMKGKLNSGLIQGY